MKLIDLTMSDFHINSYLKASGSTVLDISARRNMGEKTWMISSILRNDVAESIQGRIDEDGEGYDKSKLACLIIEFLVHEFKVDDSGERY